MIENTMTSQSNQMQRLTGQLQMQAQPAGLSLRLTSLSAQPLCTM